MYKISDGTEFVGKGIILLPKCHSTNDIAAELWNKGIISPGSVVITDHQTKGRGQRGNTWESDPGVNLTFSLVLIPDFLNIQQNFYLNIVTSLAITDALMKLDNSFSIKWPNDIIYRQKKIGGILIENSLQSERIIFSVIGIGINVNQAQFTLVDGAISLYQIFKHTFNLNDLLNQLLKSMDQRWKALYERQFNKLKTAYIERLYGLHRMKDFQIKETIRKGRITGIDVVGRLEVLIDGKLQKFNFQEIKCLN